MKIEVGEIRQRGRGKMLLGIDVEYVRSLYLPNCETNKWKQRAWTATAVERLPALGDHADFRVAHKLSTVAVRINGGPKQPRLIRT